ncbi:MAG TPA: hypothetical protein VM345_19815 [Acidimicrobiales bacterium]|jgi:hypothetical protein|nr:hypothetical protein [Acidimicrobiales bacterium]
MEILSATFVENIEFRQAEGGTTRIDLSGVHFSLAAPSPPPVTIAPHLVVLVRCRVGESDFSALEVVFTNEAGEQVARSVMPFQVEPGKFGYRLVRAELTFDDYGTIEAHCQLDDGPKTVVPLTLVAPA